MDNVYGPGDWLQPLPPTTAEKFQNLTSLRVIRDVEKVVSKLTFARYGEPVDPEYLRRWRESKMKEIMSMCNRLEEFGKLMERS